MKIRHRLIGVIVVILLVGLLTASWPATAQDALPLEVLTLQFSAAPPAPPTVEPAGDTFVFKITAVGTLTGDLEGTFTQHVTQVDPAVADPVYAVNQMFDITTFFTIETAEGAIEGYYAGAFYFPENAYPDAVVHQRGQVLSVTPAYANLFLADVYYDGIVDFEDVDGNVIPLGDSGSFVIAPR